MPRNTTTLVSLSIKGVKLLTLTQTYSCRETAATELTALLYDRLHTVSFAAPVLRGPARHLHRAQALELVLRDVSPNEIDMTCVFNLHERVTRAMLAIIVGEIADIFRVRVSFVSRVAPTRFGRLADDAGEALHITGPAEVLPAWWWAVAASRQYSARVLTGPASASDFPISGYPMTMDQLLDRRNTLADSSAWDNIAVQNNARHVWNTVVLRGRDAPGIMYLAHGLGPDRMTEYISAQAVYENTQAERV